MAIITLDRAGTSTNLRVVFSSGALFLPAAGGALQAHSGTATDYHVSAASSVALATGVNRHTFTVPVPTVLPVTLDGVIMDIVAESVAGSVQIALDADGDEVDQVGRILDLLEADRWIDKTTDADAWALVLIKQGTGDLGDMGAVELLRQPLYDVNGAAIAAASTIRGRAVTASE